MALLEGMCHTTSLTSVVDESCYIKKRRKLVERCAIIIKKPNFTGIANAVVAVAKETLRVRKRMITSKL